MTVYEANALSAVRISMGTSAENAQSSRAIWLITAVRMAFSGFDRVRVASVQRKNVWDIVGPCYRTSRNISLLLAWVRLTLLSVPSE